MIPLRKDRRGKFPEKPTGASQGKTRVSCLSPGPQFPIEAGKEVQLDYDRAIPSDEGCGRLNSHHSTRSHTNSDQTEAVAASTCRTGSQPVRQPSSQRYSISGLGKSGKTYPLWGYTRSARVDARCSCDLRGIRECSRLQGDPASKGPPGASFRRSQPGLHKGKPGSVA